MKHWRHRIYFLNPSICCLVTIFDLERFFFLVKVEIALFNLKKICFPSQSRSCFI